MWMPATVDAQTADNLLLVVNASSPASVTVADRYAAARQVPGSQIVRITTTDADNISRAEYEATIEAPIATWLTRHQLQDQVLYVVLTKGIPLRIDGTGGLSGTMSSVDSELTLLYRKMVGAPVSIVGRQDNPFFLNDRPIADARRFSRLTSDLFLVTRLDGFTVDDVERLIDRGMSPGRDGSIVLDQRATPGDRVGGDTWLSEAATRLTTMNQSARVQLETTRAVSPAAGPVIGYFSWGSNDPAFRQRTTGLQFTNGAIGGLFVSTDGRSFREPPAGWKPGPPGAAAGGQSLAGDLIREGLTGVSGHVAEPYSDALLRPQVLFPAYLSGFNLAEAYYLAMPFLSWQDVVIGDPLCSPFQTAPVAQDQLHKGLDPDVDIPAMFLDRRLAILAPQGFNVAALKLQFKAESALLRGRPASEAHPLLVQATALEPRLIAAQMTLALAAEARQDHDDAIARYRAILAVDSDQAVALNNLAYALAERKGAAAEALPLAEKAYRLSGQAAAVADTLGWVLFKNGNAAAAVPYVDRAAKLESGNVDILIHAAFVHAGANNLVQARAYLDAALKLDGKAADRPDVKALQAKIR